MRCYRHSSKPFLRQCQVWEFTVTACLLLSPRKCLHGLREPLCMVAVLSASFEKRPARKFRWPGPCGAPQQPEAEGRSGQHRDALGYASGLFEIINGRPQARRLHNRLAGGLCGRCQEAGRAPVGAVGWGVRRPQGHRPGACRRGAAARPRERFLCLQVRTKVNLAEKCRLLTKSIYTANAIT